MRPFRFFFGISLAVFVFFFLLRFVVVAFIAAAVLSIVYAIFRRMKDFINYDRFGKPYFDPDREHPQFQRYAEEDFVEPLFYESKRQRHAMPIGDVKFVNVH